MIVAFLSASDSVNRGFAKVNAEHGISEDHLGGEAYKWLGVVFFAIMGFTLYRVCNCKEEKCISDYDKIKRHCSTVPFFIQTSNNHISF